MDALISRFRNLMVLTIVVAIQLILLAYQVKTNQDIRLVRVWAVTAITPAARVIESVRSGTTGFFSDYFFLLDVRDENERMKSELGRLKLENQFLKTELSTADRARALAAFQSRSPSRTIPARIIGNGTGANSKVVFIDRGSTSGVQKGMAVITPDGIVGKVIQSFPVASQVLLVTDPTFAAGVVSQKNHVRGTVKGQGGPNCIVDYVENEEKVDRGEWFYTSGDDRVFPKGVPVGQATVVREGRQKKEIYIAPSGLQGGFDEVLVVLEGIHQPIPEASEASATLHMLPPPPDSSGANSTASVLATDADRMLEKYRKIGEAQGHEFGKYGSPPPNFNVDMEKAKRPVAPGGGAASTTPPNSAPPATTATPPPAPVKPAPEPATPRPAEARPVTQP
jgi:rod shape-determining protein MreC